MKYKILCVDKKGIAPLEISKILKDIPVSIRQATDIDGFRRFINDTENNKFDLIIWMLNSNEDAEVFCDMMKSGFIQNLPVFIMAYTAGKNIVVKAVECGASGYIALPCDDNIIKQKIYKVLGINNTSSLKDVIEDNVVTYEVKDIINREIKAASRGSYNLALLLLDPIINTISQEDTSLSLNDLENQTNHKELKKASQTLCDVIKSRGRETDYAFLLKDNSILLILPFTSMNGLKTYEEKIKQLFLSHAALIEFSKVFSLKTSYVSFPQDGRIKDNLLELLYHRFND